MTLIGKRNKRRVIELDPFNGYDLFRGLPAFARSPLLFWHGDGQSYKNFASQFAAIIGRVFTAKYDAVHGTNGSTRPNLKDLRRMINEPDLDVGFRPFRFHDLRHWHAVQWLKQGRSIYDLKERLGHTSVKTTEPYLEFLTPEEKRGAMGFAQAAQSTSPLKVPGSMV
jgi:integrase/recombinase XerD